MIYVGAALDVCGFVVRDLRTVVGDTPGIQTAENQCRWTVTYLGGWDIRTGRPRTTPPAADWDLGL